MEWVKTYWHKIPHPLRKLLIFVAGWSVVIAGVAMLALPGPGWATIFLGFAILATEYTSAQVVRDKFISFFKLLATKAKKIFKQLNR